MRGLLWCVPQLHTSGNLVNAPAGVPLHYFPENMTRYYALCMHANAQRDYNINSEDVQVGHMPQKSCVVEPKAKLGRLGVLEDPLGFAA